MTNTLQPDIFVVCDPDKLDEHKCNGAPNWVIEILSLGTDKHYPNPRMRQKELLFLFA